MYYIIIYFTVCKSVNKKIDKQYNNLRAQNSMEYFLTKLK